MSRTRVRRRRHVVGIVLAAGAASVLAGPVARAVAPSPVPVAQHRYVVRSGDTLWSIATAVAPGSDPRPLVDAIAAANAVDPGALSPGQSLVIPAS